MINAQTRPDLALHPSRLLKVVLTIITDYDKMTIKHTLLLSYCDSVLSQTETISRAARCTTNASDWAHVPEHHLHHKDKSIW